MKKIGLILAVLVMLLGGCGPITPSTRGTSTPAPSGPRVSNYQLVLSDEKCWLERDVMKFSGVITNESSFTVEYVEIRMLAYSERTLVGENTWYIDSDQLRPGASSSYDGFIRLGGQKANKCNQEVDDFRIR